MRVLSVQRLDFIQSHLLMSGIDADLLFSIMASRISSLDREILGSSLGQIFRASTRRLFPLLRLTVAGGIIAAIFGCSLDHGDTVKAIKDFASGQNALVEFTPIAPSEHRFMSWIRELDNLEIPKTPIIVGHDLAVIILRRTVSINELSKMATVGIWVRSTTNSAVATPESRMNHIPDERQCSLPFVLVDQGILVDMRGPLWVSSLDVPDLTKAHVENRLSHAVLDVHWERRPLLNGTNHIWTH